jgi:hypothetical protein
LLRQAGVASVQVLVLDGRDEPDLAVQPAEVEPVDAGDGDLEVVDVFPGAEVAEEFGLNRLLNASAMALSYESPLLPTQATTPTSARRSV